MVSLWEKKSLSAARSADVIAGCTHIRKFTSQLRPRPRTFGFSLTIYPTPSSGSFRIAVSGIAFGKVVIALLLCVSVQQRDVDLIQHDTEQILGHATGGL
jgi:hypothetical protein